ncbi:MAG: UDP-N-acetylmuramoyl-L-alanyl-D-glutamate--2,6-diaminopimelate ligase [Methylococcaceae bacterium]|nr:UDP-N-acetylmuramoyl-L-alanyl-D-glutamate--2,6-diaminopimelate ligase [Methylococcaceae bacterium]
MRLKELLKGFVSFSNSSMEAAEDVLVTGLALHSREVIKGSVFIALAGARQHGLIHVAQALEMGACAVVFDPAGGSQQIAEKINNVPIIAVDDLGLKLGDIAARYYGNPSGFMAVIGITGTNGKTSCSQFLSQMLDGCGIIGTLGWGEWGKLNKTLNTTPDALETQRILAELLKDNKKIVAMEVSSHGLEQGRVNGVTFKGAVFTNISRDHLDYHGTMDAYLQAKLTLLNKPGLAFVVVNIDDFYSDQIVAAVPEAVVIWGISVQGKTLASCECVSAENILHKVDGIEFDVHWRGDSQRVKVPLYGDFNTENVLTVLAVMLAMGVSMPEAVKKLEFIEPVTGRMERFGGDEQPLIFVDYAHTPDALDKVLSSLRKHCQQALWVVFGCGGNRDKGKRPQMGRIAEQWADHVIITDDNPRFENGLDIVDDILAGCSDPIDRDPFSKVEVIQNREQAIQKVIARAADKDCIVVAGKGHEHYQEINGVQIAFSDSRVVIDALKMRAG